MALQLTNIKIAGFKSFVDPANIALPSNRVAVVGPNGCGKSNIIDAVTWVMGESSPKYLRGESLTDVIFNGSNGRKPIGQASVELVFNNQDGSIGGEYAQYAEISVKRMINRESDSSYFLNGVRCRKKDVVAIFLGTGLGPRSYSIIGQNMISRIIEAKPEELRNYLEEAAGISKYKERRRETELRIQHTQENMARVNDVRVELEKQLNHLQNQANVAEKYKTLRQQERESRADWFGYQWRTLDGQMVEHSLQIQQDETALEARMADLTSTERDLEQSREDQRELQDTFQEIQKRYYAVGNDITRIEQEVLHQKERQHQWENDLKQTGSDWQLIKEQQEEAEDQLNELERDIQEVEPRLFTATQESESLHVSLANAEEAMQTWQNRWDAFNSHSAKLTQTAEVEQTRIQHLEQRMASLQKRVEYLREEISRYDVSELNNEIADFSKQAGEVAAQLEAHRNELAATRQAIAELQTQQKEAASNLDQVRSELQRLRGQQASLEALQQTALGQRDNPAAPWVDKFQLGGKPRLAQHIQVEAGWEFAVEKVLGFCLQAICVDSLTEVAANLADLTSGNVCVFAADSNQTTQSQTQKGTLLLEKIKCTFALDSLIAGIYVADSLEAALQLSATLAPQESVITRDGYWVGRAWIKILREENAAAGVFQRETELKLLAARIEQSQSTQAELENQIEERKTHIQQKEQQLDELQQAYNQQQAQSAQLNAQHKMKEQRLAEIKTQADRYTSEMTDGQSQLIDAQAEFARARQIWQESLTELEKQANVRDELLKERDITRETLQTTRVSANEQKEAKHALEIRLQTAKSQKSSLNQQIERLGNQLASLSERKESLQAELNALPPIDALQQTLTDALEKHVSIDAELKVARANVEAIEQTLRELEDRRHAIDQDINKFRTQLESCRVQLQGWKVKADTLLEQIKETEFSLEDVMQRLPAEGTTAEELQKKVEQISNRIQRLGPINLVAIDEFATCSERKQYLDQQIDDLQAGLNTLEEAMAKIDRETKTRFKETFDKVNERFQELFPTVFGGGKAYLELTSEELLEAGVSLMACPPGKRNSTIYLLSGGEKSLTAIALIFSIFHLNPAPFCLLDEVDAALDDANVLRFVRLVKMMSEKTQFIFISHNKLTIEMGEHLIGVTMNEPGVSRLVSVDIEKAISLATTE